MFPNCQYWQDGGHPDPNDNPDNFAEKVVHMLAKGIQAQTPTGGGGGSPAKKPKPEPSTLT